MTKQEFFDSLIWVEGMPPVLRFPDGSFYETALADNCPPMAVKTKRGDLMILGNDNLNFGGCDCCSDMDRLGITAYAYLYEPVPAEDTTT